MTYKILFDHVDLDVNLFEFCSTLSTRGHQYKLHKYHTNHDIRSSFLCEQIINNIINVWNSLPSIVLILGVLIVLSSLYRFCCFTVFLKCF